MVQKHSNTAKFCISLCEEIFGERFNLSVRPLSKASLHDFFEEKEVVSSFTMM